MINQNSNPTFADIVMVNIGLILLGIVFCNINMPYIGAPLIIVPLALLCTIAVGLVWFTINKNAAPKYTSTPDIENPYQHKPCVV